MLRICSFQEMIEPKTLEKQKSIPEGRWGEIYGRLVGYAATRLRLSGFQPRLEIDGIEPDDLVGNAIEKIFDGKRAWEFERFPDSEIHLKGLVKSLISSHLKSSGRRPIVQELELAERGRDTDDSPRDQSDYADETDELRITEAHWSYIEQQFWTMMMDCESFISGWTVAPRGKSPTATSWR
ncbi:hypothetical protein ACFP1I_22120 [Dyadobacter subterraneus]|uniref:Uncharacterized protein n=1 Tax=Dyadobacter subterraneus TaxID=2773304 RepID=A0ABR9WJB5_9BACT|nr:hypothetical protein [Dyadobacter subterraneus]MBE9465535.1 hypothetical protein [Dyadobacter subterraneus]